MSDYGIHSWSSGNFFIDEGKIKVNYKNKPALIDIVHKLRKDGYKGPLLLRFPHLIKKQIDLLYKSFNRAKEEFNYKGDFKAVFPLKVNQFPNFVNAVIQIGKPYHYGLEAGSKAELMLAMSYNNKEAPITVNGFKDKAMITLGFICAKMGHDITLTIEGLNELETIIEVAKEVGEPFPNIGLRIRLHTSGIGIWAKSGGINSKFGLTSTEILDALEMIKSANMIENLKMIHFHIGSQINDISPVKKALREAGNIYAELIKLGATNLDSINLGGGLAVEYSQHENRFSRNYTLKEFTNDVIYLLKDISSRKGVPEPHIYTESGRFISASHAVLIAPVLELYSQEYETSEIKLKEKNPELIEELNDLYKSIHAGNALEYLHDSLDHMESLLTLFDLGYIDLQDRSNTEILVHLIIKKVLHFLSDKPYKEILNIQDRVQERYLVNFSIFQSLPDFWGLEQSFPVMPLDRLDITPNRSASLWDITCDSDGEIGFDIKNPLFLHDIDVKKEDYFLGFFLVGAYQEVLGMRHNLFTHPTEATIEFDSNGDYVAKNIIEAQRILDVLEDLDYDVVDIKSNLKSQVQSSPHIKYEDKQSIIHQLDKFLNEHGYLRTIPNKNT